MNKQISNLELTIESLRDEIRALKSDQRAKDTTLEETKLELKTIHQKLQATEAKCHQEAPILQIAIDVRMRYMEQHRLNMNLPRSAQSRDVQKAGDRAAHRGRAVEDAWLYESHVRKDPAVYEDLYGISYQKVLAWKEIPEIREVCGFHASLKSDAGMTETCKRIFVGFFDAVAIFDKSSVQEIKDAFRTDKALIRRYYQVQECYDAAIQIDPPRWRREKTVEC